MIFENKCSLEDIKQTLCLLIIFFLPNNYYHSLNFYPPTLLFYLRLID